MQANFSSSEVYLSWLEHESDRSFFTRQLLTYHILPYALLALIKFSESSFLPLHQLLDLRLFIIVLFVFPVCYLYSLRERSNESSYVALSQFYYILMFLFWIHWAFVAIWVFNTLGFLFEKQSRVQTRRLDGLI